MRGITKKERYWQESVTDWRESGLSIAEFCKQRGIAPSTFWYWKKWSEKNKDNEEALFLPVHVSQPSKDKQRQDHPENEPIEILVGNKYVVRVTGTFVPTTLDGVLSVLEER